MKTRIIATLTTLMATLVALPAFAAEEAASGDASAIGWKALGAGIAIGVAAFGGGLGQGRASAAALEGIARNPQASDRIFTPMILGLAFIESLVIYALIIALKLAGFF